MFSFHAFAGNINQVSSFSKSLEKYLLIDTQHIFEIVPKISIKKPNAFQRWQMEKSGAEATYNDLFLKTVTLLVIKL